MTVDLVPSTDLAPSLPSRVVTVNVLDVQEGGWAAGQSVHFSLVGDVHVPADRRIVLGREGVRLDLPEGRGQVRLPVWTAATGEWAVKVQPSWTPHPYYIRVPAGSGSIDLSQINPLSPVDQAVAQWLLTNASATVTEGAAWGVNVNVAGGSAHFDFTVPPGGQAWSRGTLPNSTNLGDLTQPSDAGLYYLPAENSYLDMPPDPRVGTTNATLLVETAHAGAGTQEISFTNTPRVWRRVRYWPSGFSDWNLTYVDPDTVTSEDVTQIAVSASPYTSVPNGTLLLIEETPRWVETFTRSPLGTGTPAGFESLWNPTDAEVVESDGATAGKVLRLTSSTATRRALVRPIPDGLALPHVTDVVMRWRASSREAMPRAIVRASGTTPESANGYFPVLRSNGELGCGYLLDGAAGTYPGDIVDFVPGDWYYTRVRVTEGSGDGLFRARIWADATPEPDVWHTESRKRIPQDPGGAGVYILGPGQAEVDWMVFSYDLGSSPILES